MRSWKECKLGDVIDVKHGYAFKGENITTEKTSDILVTPGNFNIGGGFKSSKFKYFNGNYPEDYIFSEGDIVVTMTDLSKEGDTLGYSAKIPKCEDCKYLHNQRVGLVKFISNDVYKDFIYWLMRTREYQSFIVGAATGTSIRHTSPKLIKEYAFELPPLEEQKAIAEVLSSLDDKIDLLHRQNQTLESLAQTLFRQWFIEEAKEKWEEKPLSEIALHVKNNVKPSSFENKSFYHFSLPAFDNGQRATKELGSEILSNKYQVIKNSILVSKLNPRTPRIWLIDENIDEDNSICSTEFQVLYPKEENWRGFIYCYLKTEQAVQELAGASSGTSGSHQRVKPEDIFNLTFQYPDIDTLKRFDEQSSVYWRKIKVNQKQIQTLENLRDTLLPKLLSGEVMVGNA